MAPKKKQSKTKTSKLSKDANLPNKRPTESFSFYIFKVLKMIHPDIGINKMALTMMDSFITDAFEKIAMRSSSLAKRNRRKMLSSREVQIAVKSFFPGQLAKHAVAGGTKAVIRFTSHYGLRIKPQTGSKR